MYFTMRQIHGMYILALAHDDLQKKIRNSMLSKAKEANSWYVYFNCSQSQIYITNGSDTISKEYHPFALKRVVYANCVLCYVMLQTTLNTKVQKEILTFSHSIMTQIC